MLPGLSVAATEIDVVRAGSEFLPTPLSQQGSDLMAKLTDAGLAAALVAYTYVNPRTVQTARPCVRCSAWLCTISYNYPNSESNASLIIRLRTLLL